MTMNKGNLAVDCVPKFIKMYLPDKSGDDLEIPISFQSFLPKSLSKSVTVRSIYGRIWKMSLRKRGGDVKKLVLVNGWKRIVKEEVLKGGDILEFEFDGSQCFNFCIYEHGSSCKRRSVQSEKVTEVESDNEEETTDLDDYDSRDSDYNCAEDEDEDDVVDADDERRYLDDGENPRFSTILNPKKKSQLLVPARVRKDYALRFPESITLVDPVSTKFGTLVRKIKIQNNGSVFVKGFGSIIRRNEISTRDKMICEIMKRGSNSLVHTIKIHIIRG